MDLLNIDYKYIFVDFDDTIVHTSYANFLAYKKSIKEMLGIDIKYINERFTYEVLCQIEQNEKIKNNIKNLKDTYYQKYLKYTVLNIDLIKTINKVEKNRVILVTEGDKKRINITLKYHKINNIFESKYFSNFNDIFNSKYIIAYQDIKSRNPNIDKSEILIFENSDLEILKAINYGFCKEKVLKIQNRIYWSVRNETICYFK